MERTRKVLSIQSHVVHGYVGNKAAAFPLQYRGWDVDALNTVQFSNHPGYGSFKGFRSQVDDLHQIIESGLVNGLQVKYDVILTGYLPSVDSLENICELVNKICMRDGIHWVLDPVLGDNGKLYVDVECVAIYKKILFKSKVYLTVPNQFEMETLTGIKIVDMKSLKQSFQQFHELYPGVERVVVSSIDFTANNTTTNDKYMVAFTQSPNFDDIQYYEANKIHAQFSGSGDLFSALLIDMLFTTDSETPTATLATAIGKCLSLTHQILHRTYELAILSHNATTANEIPHINDLRLIQCTDILQTHTIDVPIAYRSHYI